MGAGIVVAVPRLGVAIPTVVVEEEVILILNVLIHQHQDVLAVPIKTLRVQKMVDVLVGLRHPRTCGTILPSSRLLPLLMFHVPTPQ